MPMLALVTGMRMISPPRKEGEHGKDAAIWWCLMCKNGLQVRHVGREETQAPLINLVEESTDITIAGVRLRNGVELRAARSESSLIAQDCSWRSPCGDKGGYGTNGKLSKEAKAVTAQRVFVPSLRHSGEVSEYFIEDEMDYIIDAVDTEDQDKINWKVKPLNTTQRILDSSPRHFSNVSEYDGKIEDVMEVVSDDFHDGDHDSIDWKEISFN
eukprot:jgi/Bigna1/144497/aug1.88_g19205